MNSYGIKDIENLFNIITFTVNFVVTTKIEEGLEVPLRQMSKLLGDKCNANK